MHASRKGTNGRGTRSVGCGAFYVEVLGAPRFRDIEGFRQPVDERFFVPKQIPFLQSRLMRDGWLGCHWSQH